MSTIFTYRRGSYGLSERETGILTELIRFFMREIPDGGGSFVTGLDLSRVRFKWSPMMALDDERGLRRMGLHVRRRGAPEARGRQRTGSSGGSPPCACRST